MSDCEAGGHPHGIRTLRAPAVKIYKLLVIYGALVASGVHGDRPTGRLAAPTSLLCHWAVTSVVIASRARGQSGETERADSALLRKPNFSYFFFFYFIFLCGNKASVGLFSGHSAIAAAA